jgi:hypothetical protein
MATELGKSVYEAEKDIAVQKDLYAAFFELMGQVVKAIPGFNAGINISKSQLQGLTVERKPRKQEIDAEQAGLIEVEQKATPAVAQSAKPIEAEPWGAGTKTLYGIGRNDLTPADIKAIAGIVAGKPGDTIQGGEGLIIKFNGKPLFETDENGKISLHTAVSPELKAKFAALQAGAIATAPALPTPTNTAAQSHEVDKQAPDVVAPSLDRPVDRRLESALVYMASRDDGATKIDGQGFNGTDSRPGNLLADKINKGIPLTDREAQDGLEMLYKYRRTQLAPAGYQLPKWDEISHQYSPAVEEQAPEVTPTVPQNTPPPSVPNARSVDSNLENGRGEVLSSSQEPSKVPEQEKQLGPFELIPLVIPQSLEPEQLSQEKREVVDPPLEEEEAFDIREEQDAAPAMSADARFKYANQQEEVVYFEESQKIHTPEPVATPQEPATGLKAMMSKAGDYMVDRAKKDTQVVLEKAAQVSSIAVSAFADTQPRAIADAVIGQYKAVKSAMTQYASPQGSPKLENSIDAYMGQVNTMFDEIERDNEAPKNPLSEQDRAKFETLFAGQKEKLDEETLSPVQQQASLKAAYTVYLKNMPVDQKTPITQPGISETPLPTGAKFVNDLTEQGVNNLFIERDGNRILLGGIYGSTYTPANIPEAMPELRQLKPFLHKDLSLSSEPVAAIPLNQPLLIAKNDQGKEPPEVKIHYSLKPLTEPVQQPAAVPVRSRGGR